MRPALLIFLTLFSTTCALGQQKVKLTNRKTNKVLFLVEGQRVQCIKRNAAGGKVGILQKVDLTHVTVDQEEIAISNISGIGKKNKGSGFGTFILSTLGGSMIGSALVPENDPCPSCQTVSSEGEGLAVAGKVLQIAGGIGLIAIAINKGIRNSPRDVENNWTLEVVD